MPIIAPSAGALHTSSVTPPRPVPVHVPANHAMSPTVARGDRTSAAAVNVFGVRCWREGWSWAFVWTAKPSKAQETNTR